MLRKHAVDLTNAITPCVNEVATALQAEDLIPLGLKSEIVLATGMSPPRKAVQLVTNLQLSLKGNPNPEKFLTDVCRVLHSQQDSTLSEITVSILQNLGK